MLPRLTTAVLLMLAGSAWALPPLQDLSGELSGAEVSSSLLALDRWFLKADRRCQADTAHCQIKLAVSVPAAGGHPDCSISSTTIADANVSGLYCQVVRTASFPSKAQPTTFTLQFPAAPGTAAAPKDPQFKLVDSAPACPDLGRLRNEDDVHTCFNQYKPWLDSVYHEAQQKNADLQGSFVIRLSINKDGQVLSAEADYVQGNLGSDFVNDELATVKKIRFGWGKEQVDTTYSVHFFGQ
jgi:hypothetical protein